ncbi:bacteriohemerythrin [Campylobacterota bacterium]
MISQEQLPMVAMPSMNDMHLEEMLFINALHEAVKSRDFNTIVEKLETLLEHTQTHFSQEEQMMEDAGFKSFYEHKGEHDRHLHELRHLIKYFHEHRDPHAIAAYVEGNLESWTIHHIKTMDTEMASFLQGQ